MISSHGIDGVSVAAINRRDEYEKLANSVEDEALYEFLKGFADASKIIIPIVINAFRCRNDSEYKNLRESIIESAGFKCTSPKGKRRDPLRNFKMGRKAACNAVLADLEIVNVPDCFTKEDAQ